MVTCQRERLTDQAWVPRWVRHEHLARYAFAARYVTGQSVVECACGDGTGTAALAAAGAARIVACDTSASAVAAARGKVSSSKVQFWVGDALTLPLTDHSADVYISFETIEHIQDDEAFLAEVRRVLSPQGMFVCSTPNRLVTNPGTSLADAPWNPFHVREYSEPELVGKLREAFHHVEWYGQNPTRAFKVRTMAGLSRILPRHGAVRLNQLLKVPRFLCDRAAWHAVRAPVGDRVYEYLVAVCREPRSVRRTS